MKHNQHNPLYLNVLEPLLDVVEHPEVEELMVNTFYHIKNGKYVPDVIGWVVLRDKGRAKDPISLDAIYGFDQRQYLLDVFKVIANVNGQTFSERNNPVLYATLPHGHRFSGVVGDNVKYNIDDPAGIAFCIRQTRSLNEIKEAGEYPSDKQPPNLKFLPAEELVTNVAKIPYEPVVDLKKIKDVLEKKKIVIIAGGTGSGKTTLVKHILTMFGLQSRFILLEDTPEITLAAPNKVTLLTSRTEGRSSVSWGSLIDLTKRFTGDVVLVGEVSEDNGDSIRKLASSGHEGAITTLHTGSIQETLREIKNYFYRRDTESAQEYDEFIRSKLGAVVVLDNNRKCVEFACEDEIFKAVENV